MVSIVIDKTLTEIYRFLLDKYTHEETLLIYDELKLIVNHDYERYSSNCGGKSYEDLQLFLSTVNEKENIRKSNGVYYTSNDVVKFIFANTVKSLYGKIETNNLHIQDLANIPYKSFCYEKTVFDPTCGAGEFLLVALSMKLDVLDSHFNNLTANSIKKVVSTIFGNDINKDSIVITQLRLFMYLLNRYGSCKIKGVSECFIHNFECNDFINLDCNYSRSYDIIIGNPPYVEDSKCNIAPLEKYGNVYANILANITKCLNSNSVIGFVIPLSYVSTPRMLKIREVLQNKMCEQYVLSYCDRPDCLFSAVHQKLCILIGKHNNKSKSKRIYTSNYHFWYKEERKMLFDSVSVVENEYVANDYIPKIGSQIDASIYSKVISHHSTLYDALNGLYEPIYLNMRAAFWVKAFRNSHTTGEYKTYFCQSPEYADLCMCVLNSSLYWWYWICISDCWHITNKELRGFTIPNNLHLENFSHLARKLENQLEKTKLYVGTKQTEYEYKHKECINEIHEIDDLICSIYGLTDEETQYIKNFAYKYRVSGGVKNENN